MLITEIKYQIATTVKWKYSCAVLGLAACHVSQNCNEKMQVRPAGQAGYPISLVASLDTVPVKCCVPLHYLKREKREEKRRKFYIYPDVTHTHTRTHTHRHAYTNTRTFTHSTFTHDSITHIHPTFSHYCIHSFTHLPSTYFFCAHRSFTISFLFPAFPIPSSHFFGCLLEEVDTSGPLILNQLVPEKNCCIPEPRLYSQGSWHIATSIQWHTIFWENPSCLAPYCCARSAASLTRGSLVMALPMTATTSCEMLWMVRMLMFPHICVIWHL